MNARRRAVALAVLLVVSGCDGRARNASRRSHHLAKEQFGATRDDYFLANYTQIALMENSRQSDRMSLAYRQERNRFGRSGWRLSPLPENFARRSVHDFTGVWRARKG